MSPVKRRLIALALILAAVVIVLVAADAVWVFVTHLTATLD